MLCSYPDLCFYCDYCLPLFYYNVTHPVYQIEFQQKIDGPFKRVHREGSTEGTIYKGLWEPTKHYEVRKPTLREVGNCIPTS